LKLTLYTYLYNFIFHAALNQIKKQGSIFLIWWDYRPAAPTHQWVCACCRVLTTFLTNI